MGNPAGRRVSRPGPRMAHDGGPRIQAGVRAHRAQARCRVVGQERFAYFGLGRHSGFCKVSRRQGGTLSGRYRSNGYVHHPTVLTAKPLSRASPLPQGILRRLTNAENNNAPSRRGVVCSGADYFLAAGAAGASAASALAGSLMPSSSRSNTSTEFAGIAGLGLWAP